MSSRRLVVMMPIAALLLTACGPQAVLDLGMHLVNVDVAGGQPPVTPVAAPQLPPRVTAPLPLLPLPAPGAVFVPPSVGPAPPACPKAGVFAVPSLEADPLIPVRPEVGQYLFREIGKWVTTGALGRELPAPPLAVREVTTGTPAKGYDFAVAEQAGLLTRTTAYSIVPSGALPTDPPGGLYVNALHWKDIVFGEITFDPTSPLLFLQTPVVAGESFTSSGVDPGHNTSMVLRGNVNGKKRVDACGKLIGTWELSVTVVLTTAQTQIQMTGTYDLATQFGGLSVQDNLHVTGTNATAQGVLLSGTPTSDLRSTINVLPHLRGK